MGVNLPLTLMMLIEH